MDKCEGSCITNKMEDMNLKTLYMIKEIIESKKLLKHIPWERRCEFEGRKGSSRQKWNYDKCRCESIKLIKYCACEKYYALNPSTRACA